MATALVAIGIAVRKRLDPRTLRLAFRLAPRLARAGVSDLFATRSDYVLYRKPSTATEYMETAERELIYVGFWLAQTGEIEDLRLALRSLLDRGVHVSLVLLDRDLDEVQRTKLAAVLNLTASGLSERLQTAWTQLLDFRRDLPGEIRPRLILKRHEEHLQASAFLFDRSSATAKTLVDFKFYGVGRQDSFGLELQPPKGNSNSSLYHRATDSFALISDRAIIVDG